ncbi:hypothetical protein [Bradyrhizobium lablabi]|uniref:hypothetical protein n=1 Tax=Bradyrhizobium lablabi TaxID=722472 RepID=UPI001BAD0258|nr:hypothetical protein [Bradyrhizobium lablabi]MBR0695647.1 hypothetical protein [Bradyrhizobium lablabi]
MSSRPDAVTQPVARSVTGARPANPSSPFPLRTLVPRAVPEYQLLLKGISLSVALPAGQILVSFPLGTVENAAFNTVTAGIDDTTLSVSFSGALLVKIDPAAVPARGLLLKIIGVVSATYQVNDLVYDLKRGVARWPVFLRDVTNPDDREAASELADKIQSALEQAIAERISATQLGDPRYSLFLDPDPAATLANVFAQITVEPERAGSTFVLGQIEEALTQELLNPATPRIQLRDIVLQGAGAKFQLGAQISQVNKKGTKTLRIIGGSSLTATAQLSASLAILFDQVSALAPRVKTGETTLLNAATSVAPILHLKQLTLEGTFDVILKDEGHLASFGRISVTPDGTVDVSQITLTPKLQEMVAQAAGIDIIAADQSLSAILAAGLAFLALANRVPDPKLLQEAARQQPEILAPVLAAGVRGHRSQLVEPVLQKTVENDIEAALTEEVRDLLKTYVEEPLGITLDQLLQGRPPKLRANR